MNKFELPELKRNDDLDEVMAQLGKKHHEYEAAMKRGDGELADKVETEFNNLLKEIRLNHPDIQLDDDELNLKHAAEDETWRLHHKPNYKDLN